MPVMGFLRIPNLTTNRKIVELSASSYNNIALEYSKKHFKEPKFKEPLSYFVKHLPKNAKVLDAGCGPGGESDFFVQNGFDTVGIDISNTMLEIAKKNISKGKFINMDLLDLKFDHSEFDGVWCCRTLIHIPKKESVNVLSNIKKILKPNGIVGICIVGTGISQEYITNAPYDSPDKIGKFKVFFREFGKNELEKELKQAGFKILKTTNIDIERESHIFVFGKK